MIEAEAIPYEPAQLRGERLLVLAPHPDDEVIGCGGLVAQHLRERREVRVVVFTDGAQGGDAAVREEESRRAVAVLGEGAAIEFLRFPDRGLNGGSRFQVRGKNEEALPSSLAPRTSNLNSTSNLDSPSNLDSRSNLDSHLRALLLTFRPDLVLVPSPIEIHPDHLALARAFCDLVQRDEALFAELAVTRVAFYEVGQPIRPNALVDISDVAELKYDAVAQHRSQAETRDYLAYTRGLNAYRAMTLPAGTKFVEAYYVVDLPSLRTTPFTTLRQRAGAPRTIDVASNPIPISVVVRTKDRLELLREAVDSIRANEYPCEIVVVNDGGARPELEGVTLVHHEESRGRSEAANAGVRAASNEFLVFLDDDDLYHPEHLATLANAASSSHAAWYTDAISAFLRRGESGAYEAHSRLRLFAQDFDRDLLLVDNYIPLPTVFMRRADFLDLGGFDPAFDLFEDWDFLIRLSARGDFLRIPRVTCEIRHFEGGTSVVLAAPEGSERFREAKLRVWEKHHSRIDHALFARVFEKQKQRGARLHSDAVESKGELVAARNDIARLEREKTQVINQNGELQGVMNGYVLRVREMEGMVNALLGIRDRFEGQTIQLERTEQLVNAQKYEIGQLHAEIDALRGVNAAASDELQRTRVEISRLTALLDMIYRSRTWKLHTLVERVRGRG